MCVVKKPSIPKSDDQGKDKNVPILRNPMLDGMLGNIAALRAGTSAFRIDLLNPLAIPIGGGTGLSPPPPVSSPTAPALPPTTSGGGSTSGGSSVTNKNLSGRGSGGFNTSYQ